MRETWRNLCITHPSDDVMSDADIAWVLNNSMRNAVGWAQNIERGGEHRHAERCKSCGRGASAHLEPYSPASLAYAWRMVARHVETSRRAALASASRRLSVAL